MPASRKTKQKKAARESSRRGRSSLSLLPSNNNNDGDTERCSTKKYHTKCQIEKYVIMQRSIVVCINPFGQSDSSGINDDNGERGRRASMFATATEMAAKAAVAVEYCSGMVLEGR